MDTAVLPLALLVLATIVQSLPFLLMPIINIICTILSSFLIMYPVALNMDVVSFTPSVRPRASPSPCRSRDPSPKPQPPSHATTLTLTLSPPLTLALILSPTP